MFELHHLSAGEQLEWLRRGEISPRELADHYLDRIARLDAGLGAFATVTTVEARDRADATLWRLACRIAVYGVALNATLTHLENRLEG